MTLSIKMFRNVFGLLWSVIVLGGLAYNFFPAGYAYVAYNSGMLPVTEQIKEASPQLWYRYQESLLNQAKEQLDVNRDRLSENRGRLNREIGIYRDKSSQAYKLLNQARDLYQANPGAQTYRFIGKEYGQGSFSAQIVVLKGQMDAANESIAALDKARVKLDDTWVLVAKKSAQLQADQTRLSTAKILWQTKHVLASLEIDLDMEGIQEISRHDIRTVEELIDDAARIPAPVAEIANAQGQEMTAEALEILNGM